MSASDPETYIGSGLAFSDPMFGRLAWGKEIGNLKDPCSVCVYQHPINTQRYWSSFSCVLKVNMTIHIARHSGARSERVRCALSRGPKTRAFIIRIGFFFGGGFLL